LAFKDQHVSLDGPNGARIHSEVEVLVSRPRAAEEIQSTMQVLKCNVESEHRKTIEYDESSDSRYHQQVELPVLNAFPDEGGF
jgi:hypothetical protein